MADFRTHSEQERDNQNRENEKADNEYEAQIALRRMEPQIADYKAEVKLLQEQVTELQAKNLALTGALKTQMEEVTETLKAQMEGVEEIKGILIDRMDNLSTDMDQVHRKIRGIAEDDMRVVKQLSDDQNDRLAKLVDMVKNG